MKETPVSRMRIQQARMLCLMGARAVTIAAATGIRPTDARAIYKEIHGTVSPPGQTPHSLEWYLERPARRLQASLLLKLYFLCIQYGYSTQQAFIAAYDVYWNIYGAADTSKRQQSERLIDPERGFYLVKRAGSFGALNAPGVGEAIAALPCRSCGLEILSPTHEAAFVCPQCASGFQNPGHRLRA